jgi:hypothetical protein
MRERRRGGLSFLGKMMEKANGIDKSNELFFCVCEGKDKTK